jgi:hypothetical protein
VWEEVKYLREGAEDPSFLGVQNNKVFRVILLLKYRSIHRFHSKVAPFQKVHGLICPFSDMEAMGLLREQAI